MALKGAPLEGVTPDVAELADIECDRDLQLADVGKLVFWQSRRVKPGKRRLSQVDAYICQFAAKKVNTASLTEALRDPHWPVQVAAAEVLGRRKCRAAASVLRELLEAEHALPKEELYPAEGAAPEGVGAEDLAKRWRLKAALIVALGRIRDKQAVPLLGRILADGRDFYAVYSVAAQALGRIRSPEALEALAPAFTENEINTRTRALDAKREIERED